MTDCIGVTAPEYGGTITFAVKLEPPSADPLFGSGASRGPDGVTEKLGIVNWGIDRGVNDLTGGFFYFPLSVLTGRLAESWETPDAGIAYLSPLVAIGSNYSQSAWNPPGLNDPEFDRLYEAARDAATEEEQIRMANQADMWLTENHIHVWGPTAPKFNAVQPWLKGYNGEALLGGDDRMVLFSRLWFDHALMEEMGQ